MAIPMRRLQPSSNQKFSLSKLCKPHLENHVQAFFCAPPESYSHSNKKEHSESDDNRLTLTDPKNFVQKKLTQQEIYASVHKIKSKRLRCGQQSAAKSINITRCGKVMKSMLYKTFWNMKDRKLIHNAEPEFDNTNNSKAFADTLNQLVNTRDVDCVSLENTFYPSRKKLSKGLRVPIISPNLLVKNIEENKLDAKELFFQKMRIKYQDPSANETTHLTEHYPNPAQLFRDVVGPLMEARELDLPEPVATSHLRQVYWRACLALPWSPSVTATHPEKDVAVHNVFLRACGQLERLGLIWLDKDRRWQPMTCDKVVSMLETLTRYIDSSFVASKGRGFKIILKQADHEKYWNDQVSVKSKQNKQQMHKKDIIKMACDVDKNLISQVCCTSNLAEDGRMCGRETVTAGTKLDFVGGFCDKCSLPNSSCSQISHESSSSTKEVRLPSHSQDGCRRAQYKAKPWVCTVHVGWPFPFTVQAWSISLPGAQMLGYMKVVTKLKTLGLLTSCNSSVSPQVLGRLMRIDTQIHWEKSVLSSLDHTLMQKFKADAELFCDASLTGFGAYLVFKEVEKVRWLCEAWEEHDKAFLDIVYPHQWMFESTLAELYATVTSVYSWKKKLRGKRLLCFSDSKTSVGLINSYLEKPVKEEQCINSLDRLIISLQATCATYSITLQAVWLDRNRNTLADKLSRRDTEAFQNTLSQATCKKTRTKKLSIPWSQYV